MRRQLAYRAIGIGGLVLLLALLSYLAAERFARRQFQRVPPSGPLTSTHLDKLELTLANTTFTSLKSRALARLLQEAKRRQTMGHSAPLEPLLAAYNGLKASRHLIQPHKETLTKLHKRLTRAGIHLQERKTKGSERFSPLRLLALLLLFAWVGSTLLFLFKGLTPTLTLRPKWATRAGLLYFTSFSLWILVVRAIG